MFWRWPRHRLQETLDKVRQRFEIEQVLYVRWTPERIVENFQRFYAMVSGLAYQKYAEAGTTPYLFVLATDPRPAYQYRIARGSGFKYVNVNSFDLKQVLRRQGGTSLHATNDQAEFRRDLMYLTGEPASEYHPPKWDGEIGTIREVHCDIVGADGWKSLSEVFAVLNEAVPYVVLRNFQDLPEEHAHGSHANVDLLVSDVDARNRAAAILDKNQLGSIRIGKRKVSFDLWSVEDFYYDPEWCRKILRHRVIVRGFYAPRPVDHFFSLLYHGHVHKPQVSSNHISTLLEIAPQIGLDWITPDWLNDPDKAASLLLDWLKGNGYCLTRPNGYQQYNWKFVRRMRGSTPFLYRSTTFSRKAVNVITGTSWLRPLVPHLSELRRQVRRVNARKKAKDVASVLKNAVK
jgi:hypothetical protein